MKAVVKQWVILPEIILWVLRKKNDKKKPTLFSRLSCNSGDGT